jgi:hypothetical protein
VENYYFLPPRGFSHARSRRNLTLNLHVVHGGLNASTALDTVNDTLRVSAQATHNRERIDAQRTASLYWPVYFHAQRSKRPVKVETKRTSYVIPLANVNVVQKML